MEKMATNLEFKGRVLSLDTLYPRLKTLSAVYRETVNQIDTYFKIQAPEGTSGAANCQPRFKLREADTFTQGWLIYYERPDENASRYSRYQITEIADPEQLKNLLTLALGIKTIVKKQREVWMFKHTRIHLDTVADLGTFVELETVFQGQTDAEAVAEHRHVKTVLHLDRTDPIAGSYSDLRVQHG